MDSRLHDADWLELSGLPTELNAIRAGAWAVFKKIVELDCRMNRNPNAVEISLGELADRTGLEWEKLAKILEALGKKKILASFIPDNPDEPGLFQVRVPVKTPKNATEVAALTNDPYLRDPSHYRYLEVKKEDPAEVEKVQKIIDLYLNTLSQKMNSFIVDEIEVIARRFPIDAIERTIHRAAKHDIRSIGWVAKELIRDQGKKAKKKSEGEKPK